MEDKIKFKDIKILFDTKTDELFITIPTGKLIRSPLDTFVRDGKQVPYRVTSFKVGNTDQYVSPEDRNRWVSYSRISVFERLLGISVEDNEEFSVKELKALEKYLNSAHKQAYSEADIVTEDGTGDLACMKKEDLLFVASNDGRTYQVDESNGKYSLIIDLGDSQHPEKSIIVVTPTGAKPVRGANPRFRSVFVKKGEKTPYGVFPDRDYFLESEEYRKFTAEAYRRMEQVKQREAEAQNTSTKGE